MSEKMIGKEENRQKTAETIGKFQDKAKICGIVRPISPIGDYPESHWADIHEIISAAVKEAGFEAKLVSDAAEIGVIQKRIVQNLYDCPLVICDVSSKNPNVMFELGMRLAFDRPAIIIKDEQTDYSFDISLIEHLQYPSSLHFQSIMKFQAKLKDKLKATYKESQIQTYSPFLKSFGELIPAEVPRKEVSDKEYLANRMNAMEDKIDFLIGHLRRQKELEIFPACEEELRRGRSFSNIVRRTPRELIIQRLKDLRERRNSVNGVKQLAECNQEIKFLERQLAAFHTEMLCSD